MHYTAYLVVHHKGTPATLHVNGSAVGCFLDEDFKTELNSADSVRKPLHQKTLAESLRDAAKEFAKLPASSEETYFSALVLFHRDGRVQRFKNGIEIENASPGEFPYDMEKVIKAVREQREETAPDVERAKRAQLQDRLRSLVEELKNPRLAEETNEGIIEKIEACIKEI
jgi:hypothetical protein